MPTPLLAELDPVQIAIVVIAMLGGFVQWIWSLIQQSKEEAEQRRNPVTPEEKQHREEAWRKQTQAQKPARPAPASTPPPLNDPFASVREIFDQIKREATQPQQPPPAPSRPPPLPTTPPPQARRGSVRADLSKRADPQPPKRHSVAAERVEAPSSTPPVTLPTAPTPPAVVLQTATRPAVAPAWAGLLGSPAALRQAFILREILGPPKALQTANDSAA
ncbi:hypothetical protein [Brevifollis gellanilyticus]|uniref:Uncharacterized protein n=1 Tax=Brevifollis gellanilyticus TaxID=748831 RepID=A0A512MGJ9_9BACT|nr:hypothetical protein [Brevifollis gellanilyticus]GEP45863.1 hypothetical protein BGE01nite_51540 [Brevifollis gellanilyticus]